VIPRPSEIQSSPRTKRHRREERRPEGRPWAAPLASALALGVALVLAVLGGWQAINYVPPFTAPAPSPMPAPNGYDRAAVAALWLAELTLKVPPREGFRKKYAQELAAALAPASPHLQEIRAAFRCEWRVPDPLDERGSGNRTRDAFERCARVFTMDAELARLRGDLRRAMDGCLDAMELGSNIARGGSVRDRYAAQACEREAMDLAERLVPQLPAEGLSRIRDRVRRIRTRWPPLLDTLLQQCLIDLRENSEELREITRKPPMAQFQELDGTSSSASIIPPPGPPPAGALSTERWHTFLTPRRSALADVERYYRERAIECAKPLLARQTTARPQNPWLRRGIGESFTGQYQGEWPRHDLILLEAAVAVRRFRLAHGRYPQRLGEVDAAWLPDPPEDLWGQPLLYQLRKGKPLLYSRGPDRVDDGGSAIEPNAAISAQPGDLVFGLLSDRAWAYREGSLGGRKAMVLPNGTVW
jgi:hypothetical protein